MTPPENIRPAKGRDRDAIIGLWHRGWHDAHGALVPSSILAYRRPEHFSTWLADGFDDTFVAEDGGAMLGFYTLDRVELSKLYVRREARGSGIAGTLLAHAERTLASRGIEEAELFCTVGNERVQLFYERHGWCWTKTFDDPLWCPVPDIETPSIGTHRYIKTLA